MRYKFQQGAMQNPFDPSLTYFVTVLIKTYEANYVKKERAHTGCHSFVTGSGRSLPPLGAIQIIFDPPLENRQ